MKVTLLTLGTRGDVQPYVNLAKGLKNHGHEVVLSTGRNFESMAKQNGIDFAPVDADFQALINSEEGKAMMRNPFLARKHLVNIVQPMMVQAMNTFYKLAKESELVLYHVKSLGDFYADQFPEKMVRANVVPAIEPTSEFPNPVFSSFGLPKSLNKLTYKLADLGMSMMNNAIRDFRSSQSLSTQFPKRLKLPSVYGISPAFLSKPKDYPANSYFTGFWQSASDQALPPEIDDFISTGKTIVVTFGSMPFDLKINPQQLLVNLSDALKINIVVVRGWGFEDISRLSQVSTIKIVDTAPFEKLFPKVRAVVHHGGVGTIAECLQAGIPFLSCPVIFPMGDQHFWGMRSFQLGCSPKPIPLKKLTSEFLIRKVDEMLGSHHMTRAAQYIASQLATENGVENCVRLIEDGINLTD
jgi:sterol 3beta-glucosyltransferase